MRTRLINRSLCALPVLLVLRASVVLASWPLGGSVVCNAPCDQVVMSSIPDTHGGMYLAWDDNRSCGNKISFVQHLDRHGAVVSGWPALGQPVCTSTVGQTTPMLYADAQGGAIVVWRDYRTGLSVFAARFAPDGAPVWDPAGVVVCDAGATQDGASVLADGTGGIYVTWMDHRLGLRSGAPGHDPLFTLFAQHVLADGSRAWGAMGAAVSGQVVNQPALLMSADATGTVVTWFAGTHMQRLNDTGVRQLGVDGVALAVSPCYFTAPDGAGGVLGMIGQGFPSGGGQFIAIHTDASGTSLWQAAGKTVATLASWSSADVGPVALIADGAGGAYFAWTDRSAPADRNVFLQRLNSAGDIAAGWPAGGVDLTPLSGTPNAPRLLADGNGGCLVFWDDARTPGTGSDVYAQHVTSTGALAPGWGPGGGSVCSAVGDQFASVVTSDGAGGALVAWQDRRSDAAGDVFAQRIQFNGALGDSTSVTAVEPRSTSEFSIGGVFPNPTGATTFAVRLSLPSGAPARLMLLDVVGRVIARQDVQPTTGGWTTVSFRRPERLAVGVYRLQLEQSGRTAVKSVAIVR